MQIQKAALLTEREKEEIFHIWNQVYPAQIAYKSVEDLQKTLAQYGNPTHFLMKSENQSLGWLSTFDRNNERWFALLIHPEHHRKGLGEKLLNEMKNHESRVNGWVVSHNNYVKPDGKPYLSPLSFYERHGFQVTTDKWQNENFETIRIFWQKKS